MQNFIIGLIRLAFKARIPNPESLILSLWEHMCRSILEARFHLSINLNCIEISLDNDHFSARKKKEKIAPRNVVFRSRAKCANLRMVLQF